MPSKNKAEIKKSNKKYYQDHKMQQEDKINCEEKNKTYAEKLREYLQGSLLLRLYDYFKKKFWIAKFKE